MSKKVFFCICRQNGLLRSELAASDEVEAAPSLQETDCASCSSLGANSSFPHLILILIIIILQLNANRLVRDSNPRGLAYAACQPLYRPSYNRRDMRLLYIDRLRCISPLYEPTSRYIYTSRYGLYILHLYYIYTIYILYICYICYIYYIYAILYRRVNGGSNCESLSL